MNKILATEVAQLEIEALKPTPDQVKAYTNIRIKAIELADVFNQSVSDCADKAAAMRELRSAVSAMNRAVAYFVEASKSERSSDREKEGVILDA